MTKVRIHPGFTLPENSLQDNDKSNTAPDLSTVQECDIEEKKVRFNGTDDFEMREADSDDEISEHFES